MINCFFCSTCHQISEALNLLAAMKANKLHPRVEVYNIFISAYSKRGQVRKAFKIFNDVSQHLICKCVLSMADYSAFPVRIALVFKVCCASECFNGNVAIS